MNLQNLMNLIKNILRKNRLKLDTTTVSFLEKQIYMYTFLNTYIKKFSKSKKIGLKNIGKSNFFLLLLTFSK